MAQSILSGCRIAGISTSVPSQVFSNINDTEGFDKTEIKKVVAMAGVKNRHISDGNICASDLCLNAAQDLLNKIGWDKTSISGLIMVTQSPDYLLPSTSCIIHKELSLSPHCAVFDVGLGCSGYPYGLWMAAMMINSGLERVLVLHGETPSRFTSNEDRATNFLFGDAGSATAIERSPEGPPWYFNLQTDGQGYDNLLIKAGGFRERFTENIRDYYLQMKGTDLFNFTIKRVPPLIEETLQSADLTVDDVDYFVFHQSNQFMMKHLAKKCQLPLEKTPIILDEFGNTGGPSIPLTITQIEPQIIDKNTKLMLLGYGVGLSWGSALLSIDQDMSITHSELQERIILT